MSFPAKNLVPSAPTQTLSIHSCIHNSNQPHLLIKSIKRHAFLTSNYSPTLKILDQQVKHYLYGWIESGYAHWHFHTLCMHETLYLLMHDGYVVLD
jgi:hypothetical protein